MTDTQMIPFEHLKPSPLNPRKTFDEKDIADLAATIARDGLLQNLTARPIVDDGYERYEIISGERRWRAVAWLIKTGRWEKTDPLPVNVRPCDDLELLKLATIENVQRTDLHPLEEAEGYHALVERGVPTEVIAEHVGKSQRHVQLRLRLVDNLAEEVKDAFAKGEVDLSRCRVLASMTTPERQTRALDQIVSGSWGYETAKDLRATLADDLRPAKRAHFDPKLYDGEIREDPEDPEGYYFADVDLFNKLQTDAVEKTRAKLAEKYAWVELVNGTAKTWKYDNCKDKKKAGCIIECMPDGEVKVYTDLVLKAAYQPARSSSSASGKADDAPRPEAFLPTKMGLVRAKEIKTEVLRTKLLDAGAEAAITLTCVAILAGSTDFTLGRNTAQAWARADPHSPACHAVFAKVKKKLKGCLEPHPAKSPGISVNKGNQGKVLKAYQVIADLPRAERHELFTALVAAHFGTFPDQELGDSQLITQVAEDLGADVAGSWSIDQEYLDTCRRLPLLELAADLQLIGTEMTRQQAEDMRVSDLRQHVLEYLERNPDKRVVIPRPFKFGTEKQLQAMAPKAASKPPPAKSKKKRAA